MTDCDINVFYLRLPNKEGPRNFTGFKAGYAMLCTGKSLTRILLALFLNRTLVALSG